MKRYVDIDWQSGACGFGIDPEKFYPSESHQIDSQAVEWCRECPIVDDCADWGIRHEAHGVWGGLSGNQRHMIRRRNNLRLEEPKFSDFLSDKPIIMEMAPIRVSQTRKSGSNDTTVRTRVAEFHDTYNQHDGVVTRAAEVMGLKPQTLAAYLRHGKNSLGMDVRPYRDDSYASRLRALRGVA